MNPTNNRSSSRLKLELELGEQLNILISAAHALNVKSAARFDPELQPAAFLLVRWLLSHGPASATALAEATAMDRSSVTRLINPLKERGYVYSEPDPNDRRGVRLSLTDSGRKQAEEALKLKETVFYGSIAKWEDNKLEQFITLLDQFNSP
ncbi:MarR family transcriptional regulator [Paenibacillus yonginensis]|uniref:MarR family transcriptional regulator n=1 Tax=Paenibacillus yonginensis TaxID=1462996 RepID=A0A1B1N421_9BACL|nr:MarR family transcriptional regulator [Paenibacillus yonginensis]ANS76162.1 MarR family transcriptional regulator [Paenibacillus yonginensis]